MFMLPLMFLLQVVPNINYIPQQSIMTVSITCPSELVGVKTPATKVVHSSLDFVLDNINNTGILPVYLVQVCK
jgi:hypothetical protein